MMVIYSILTFLLFVTPEGNAPELPVVEVSGSAERFIRMLEDPDPEVRRDGIQGIRRLTSRFVRSGLRNVPQGPTLTPIAEHLIPHLISAADDEDPSVRILALFALADTRDVQGVAALRNFLEDPQPKVRLTAACLLTEFGEDTGLPHIRRALERHVSGELPLDLLQGEHVLVALTRLAGEDVSSVPGNPLVSSSMKSIQDGPRVYDQLLRDWARRLEETGRLRKRP